MTTRPTILVCDDEELIRWALHEQLRQDGYQVLEAEDGACCLDRLSEVTPDALILDLAMPHLDGLEVLQHLSRYVPDVPVLLLTARAPGHPSVQRALELPQVSYLEKPFALERLSAALREMLD